jgi:hypothetical protein
MSETMKMTRSARRRYAKGDRPDDPLDRLVLAIVYAINDEVTVQNVTDIAQSIVAKVGSMEMAIEIVESGELTFENMGPVGDDFRYVTWEQMALETAASVEKAIEAFDSLEEMDLVEVKKRDEHGVLYRFNPKKMPELQVH